jgi:DNA-binding SARP family transcriptional activator
LRRGEYERGVVLLEEALRLQRGRGLFSGLAITLSNLATEAFWNGDDERFERAVAELAANLFPGTDSAWKFWLAAAAGDATAEPTGSEPLAAVGCAYTFLAAAPGPHRRISAVRAVEAGERSGDPIVRTYAYIALAEIDGSARRAMLEGLRRAAAECDMAAFRSAIEAYVTERTDLGSLQPWVTRLRGAAPSRAQVVVDIARGAVVVEGSSLHVPRREMAVLTYLVLANRVISRETICDAIWPDADPSAAANHLKVVVHHIRKRLGEHAIVYAADGYCLGRHVSGNLRDAERLVRQSNGTLPLDETRKRRLDELVEALQSRETDLLQWDWYVSVSHRLDELLRAALLLLAEDALARKQPTVALQVAEELASRDPADEDSCRLAIEAHALQNDLPSARSELRRFAKVVDLENEGDALLRVRAAYRRAFPHKAVSAK